MTRAVRAIALTVLVALGAVVATPTHATAAAEPSVALERSTVKVGDKILVTLQGWPAQRAVSISLCGNGATRGSIDCDLTNSLGYGVSAANPVQSVLFRITPPPMPCPCVIQVSNTTQSETALAPITLEGFPTAPVVGNRFESPLSVDLEVRRTGRGPLEAIRSSLGGPTRYELTVAVRNRSAEDVRGVKLTARAGRGPTDQARLVKMQGPDVLAAGTTWRRTQEVDLAAPVAGRFTWTVSASGAGPTVQARSVTRHVPLLLLLLILVLTADLAAMLGRRIRARRVEPGPSDDGDGDDQRFGAGGGGGDGGPEARHAESLAAGGAGGHAVGAGDHLLGVPAAASVDERVGVLDDLWREPSAGDGDGDGPPGIVGSRLEEPQHELAR